MADIFKDKTGFERESAVMTRMAPEDEPKGAMPYLNSDPQPDKSVQHAPIRFRGHHY